MKILVHINHYFGENIHFTGKSTITSGKNGKNFQEKIEDRKDKITKTIDSLQSINDQVTIRICGYENKSILPLDIDFKNVIDKPTDIMYASLLEMEKYLDLFDYFINIEDDILLSKKTFSRIVEFDKNCEINELLHPNRLEKDKNSHYHCIDLEAIPGWNYNQKIIMNHKFRQALNPHSGLAIFSKKKMRYAFANSDIKQKSIILYAPMDSAFASIHSCFTLWRCFDSIEFHSVIHLDSWRQPADDIIRNLKLYDFIPMVIPKLLKYFYLKFRSVFL